MPKWFIRGTRSKIERGGEEGNFSKIKNKGYFLNVQLMTQNLPFQASAVIEINLYQCHLDERSDLQKKLYLKLKRSPALSRADTIFEFNEFEG